MYGYTVQQLRCCRYKVEWASWTINVKRIHQPWDKNKYFFFLGSSMLILEVSLITHFARLLSVNHLIKNSNLFKINMRQKSSILIVLVTLRRYKNFWAIFACLVTCHLTTSRFALFWRVRNEFRRKDNFIQSLLLPYILLSFLQKCFIKSFQKVYSEPPVYRCTIFFNIFDRCDHILLFLFSKYWILFRLMA